MVKMNKSVVFAANWMGPNGMLSKTSHNQKKEKTTIPKTLSHKSTFRFISSDIHRGHENRKVTMK